MTSVTWRTVARQFGRPLLVLGMLLCVGLALRSGTKGVSAIPTPDVAWLGLAGAMFLAHYFVQAVGWHMILTALGERVPAQLNVRAWYLSMIARWMPGRIWYFSTRGYLSREAGVSIPAFTVAMILELAYVLVGGILATALFAGAVMRSVLVSGAGRTGVVGFGVLLAVTCALAVRPAVIASMCRFALVRRLLRRVSGKDLSDLQIPAMSTGRSMALLLYYTIFWVYSGVMFGVLARAFISMTPARWSACIPAFAGSWLVGYLSIVTPAGLGAREGAMWLMLREVMPQSQAVILAVASRLMMMATELASAGITYIALRGAVHLSSGSDVVTPGEACELQAAEAAA